MKNEDRTTIVGIDLGTTFSLVGIVEDGRPRLLANALGEVLTASAVSVAENGEILVGAPAQARVGTHPERTAAAFKRDMGTDRVFRLGERSFTAPELSALVLRSLKEDAENALGHPVEAAVVSVPAYFDDLQRQAVWSAAEIAGLRVERIINEPTAAAIAYGLHNLDRELRAVVLDLGGGTFDVTVLEILEGVIEIQSSAGDSRLGGEDFVDVLAEEFAKRVASTTGQDVQSHKPAWAAIRSACEAAKKRLSSEHRTRVVVACLPLPDGTTTDFEEELSRVDAELLWAPVLSRLRAPIHQALNDAKVAPGDIDEVLMVGGATRMPCVVHLAAQVFGRLPNRNLQPDQTVAMGAALVAALQNQDESVDDLVVTDVAPFSLGVATVTSFRGQIIEGMFTPVLERGTVIPASRVKRFHTVHPGQRQILIEVFQGEHAHCEHNRGIGEYTIRDLPTNREVVEVDVRFTYDLNGILEVETSVVGTDRAETLLIEQHPGRLTAEQIASAREQMAHLKVHPRKTLPNAAALARAEELYARLTGGARAELGDLIGQFRAVLESQEEETIDLARAHLITFIDLYRPGNC